MTALVAMAVVIVATVVAAALAVVTLLLLGAVVGIVVKVNIMQNEPTASSCAART